MTGRAEIIVVRSLTDTDLALFAVHRRAERGRQRAININAPHARRLLGPALLAAGGGLLDCELRFDGEVVREARRLSKQGRNFRLSGRKVPGEAFAALDSRDFMLIRSVVHNDGDAPVAVTFVSRNKDAVLHAGLVARLERRLRNSMTACETGDELFDHLALHCPPAAPPARRPNARTEQPPRTLIRERSRPAIPPMPRDLPRERPAGAPRSVKDKVRSPLIMERMLQVAGDLSGPAQLRFMDTVEALATELRALLLEADGIIKLRHDHSALWERMAGQPVGFIDGGLANLATLGSAPVAARVGGYVVTPGDYSPERESFTTLKYLIDELYADKGGVFAESYPDISGLRDAARIAIEAAGAVRLAKERPDVRWLMLHGALVNPVSRYTDQREDRKLRHRFPPFSDKALGDLLPGHGTLPDEHAERVFVSVYRKQLEALQASDAVVCGVVERESSSTSVSVALSRWLPDDIIRDLTGSDANDWRSEFREALNPADDSEAEGQRISDSLLFRVMLEPGEALRPVPIDRNDERRAPKDWWPVIQGYPKPWVSYLQPTEWSAPVRIELFEKDVPRFQEAGELVFHCALLLPRYAFPVGLQIVDQFAKIPNWMSRPVNTHTTVTALRQALDSGNMSLFDSIRRMLCGSSREWLLRPIAGR